MKFYFCETCGKRVTDGDVEAGQARNKKLKGVYCKDCAVGVMTLETMPISEEQARKILGKTPTETPSISTPVKARRESGIVQLPGARKPGDSSAPLRMKQADGSPLPSKKRNSVFVGVAAGLAIAGVLGGLLLFTGGDKTGASTGNKTAAANPPPPNVAPPPPVEAKKTTVPPIEASKSATPTDTKTPAASKDESIEAKTVEDSKSASVPDVTAAKTETTPQDIASPKPPDTAAKSEDPVPAAEKPATPPDPQSAAKLEEAENQKRFEQVLKGLAPLLRQNKWGDAEQFLDQKLHDQANNGIAERIKKERTDVATLQALRGRAMEALRAKTGTVVTLKKGTMSGTVKAGSNKDSIGLALKNGPEFTVTASQLELDDILNLLPVIDTEPGKAEDLCQRGLLCMAAGEMAEAEKYFTKAREAGSAGAEAYLARMVSLKQELKESAAADAWKKAEELFTAKNWKAAKQAYETFQRDCAGTVVIAKNAELLKERLEAIGWALGPPRELSLDLGGGVKMELMLIPTGEFEMGSNGGEKNEKPVHKVKITKPFYMGKFTVTEAQYGKIMGTTPRWGAGQNMPQVGVNWSDAQAFCKKAGKLSGNSVRLPTEAEWEYACRAGTKTTYNTGDSEAALKEVGWFERNSTYSPHPVGQKKPNAWGLYDMHGNVWQWCQDGYDGDYYSKSPASDPEAPPAQDSAVMRGGSWFDQSQYCRSACRKCEGRSSSRDIFGFRVVVVPAPKIP